MSTLLHFEPSNKKKPVLLLELQPGLADTVRLPWSSQSSQSPGWRQNGEGAPCYLILLLISSSENQKRVPRAPGGLII